MNTRIAGYDLARSLAVFGLVAVNFSGDVEHADFYWLHSFIQERTIATFLVLGGVGISLLKQRDQRTNDAHRSADSRKRLVRRAAFLLVVGICCNLIWHTNFLCRYSICIAIGALLLTVSNRWLWSLAFVFIAIWAVFVFLVSDYKVGWDWSWKTLWEGDLWTVDGMLRFLIFSRPHIVFPWAAFLLIGMWLGRKDVQNPKTRRNVFFGGVAIALVLECAPWLLLRCAIWLEFRPDFSVSAIDAVWSLLFTLHYFFARGGSAIGIIGGSLMLTEKYPSAKWTRPFIATGQLALTLYVAHLIIGGGLLKVLGALDKTLPLAIGSAVIFCICAVVFSHFWRKRYDRGPLEWGMRRITG